MGIIARMYRDLAEEDPDALYPRVMPSWPARLLSYLIVGILTVPGPVLLLVASGTGMERVIFIRSSVTADGVIVGLRGIPGSSRKSWAPMFRFTTQDGLSVTVNSDIYQAASAWPPGRHVRVLYQQGRPENARIDSFWQLWMPQFVLGVVGAGFSSVTLVIVLARLRSAASSRSGGVLR